MLQLVLGQDGRRGKDLVADEALVLARRIVAALHVLLQLGPGLEVPGTVGTPQAHAGLEVVGQLPMGVELRLAAQILSLAHSTTKGGCRGS